MKDEWCWPTLSCFTRDPSMMVWHWTLSVIRAGCIIIRGHHGAGHQWSPPRGPGERRHQAMCGIMWQVLTTRPDTRKCWYKLRSFRSLLWSFSLERTFNIEVMKFSWIKIDIIFQKISKRMNIYLLMIHFYDALQTIPILNACILNFYLKLKDEINISQENIHLSINFIFLPFLYTFCF